MYLCGVTFPAQPIICNHLRLSEYLRSSSRTAEQTSIKGMSSYIVLVTNEMRFRQAVILCDNRRCVTRDQRVTARN
jgi:hypothetical protein